ncbi:uncharacterized protein LOC127257560 [Andrographis paniculata]|uniref:uncharacterized protein LOC127257560 n=1 Tax=Andrographis paniculata TaxID=175694 RepID=UPI0021E7A0F6|nr:uncharacterized protein LOC127257560 [Andrographis paniculata]
MISILRRNITCLFTNYASTHSIYRAVYLRLFSTSNEEEYASSAAIFDLLRHKHQLSAEVATKAASVLNRVKDLDQCDSILSFLTKSGFSNAQVEKIVESRAVLLFASLEDSVKPKIRVFQGMGFCSEDIARIISTNPKLLHSNLNSRVVPLLSMVKSLVTDEDAIAKFGRRSGWSLTCDLKRSILPNIEILKSCGVPMERIIKLMYTYPRCMMLKPERFRMSVERAEEMGANRNSKMFIYALRVVSQMSAKTLELKLQGLRDCGFTESEITAIFQKAPSVFCLSVDGVKRTKDFVLSNGKYDTRCIVNSPTILTGNLEKRFKPRFQILEKLEAKKLIKRWPSLSTLHQLPDEKFYETFVGPYLSELNNGKSSIDVNKDNEVKAIG